MLRKKKKDAKKKKMLKRKRCYKEKDAKSGITYLPDLRVGACGQRALVGWILTCQPLGRAKV